MRPQFWKVSIVLTPPAVRGTRVQAAPMSRMLAFSGSAQNVLPPDQHSYLFQWQQTGVVIGGRAQSLFLLIKTSHLKMSRKPPTMSASAIFGRPRYTHSSHEYQHTCACFDHHASTASGPTKTSQLAVQPFRPTNAVGSPDAKTEHRDPSGHKA
ncbi:hypothetical protein BKA80DRAFT_33191 [Phyllosticta citrichinensis]